MTDLAATRPVPPPQPVAPPPPVARPPVPEPETTEPDTTGPETTQAAPEPPTADDAQAQSRRFVREGRGEVETGFAESAPPSRAPAHAPAPPPVARSAVEDGPASTSHFDSSPPFRSRRNPLKIWTWAASLFAVLAVAAILAVSYLGLPDWMPINRPIFAVAQPELQLDFPPEQQERRQLPNGTEFFGASGTITNVGREARNVPSILIVLRDGRDRIVYSWEVMPSKRSLAPGESISVNEAVTDVPRSARFAEIGWKPG